MRHYFTENDDLPSEKRLVTYVIDDVRFTLISDLGVFSKDELDLGSETLLKVLLKEKIQGPLLDLGSGIGTIGLTLAKLRPGVPVTLLEISSRAVALSQINAEKLQLENVDIRQSDIYSALSETEKFAIIVTNPPIRAGKQVVYGFLGESQKHLVEHGQLYFVMRKSHGAKSAAKYVETIFGNCELVKKNRGFYVYRAVNQPTVQISKSEASYE
ncbi:MAG: class I SAM-dependent methyltransferase [Bacilli bacterium]|jgi:16S rRNA (guanine1207-N2)-methyltransferase